MIRCIRLVVAALFLSVSVSLGVQTATLHDITIFHFNDLHARLTSDSGRGGFAHLATLLKQERATTKNSITLFGGDLVQGTPVSTLFQGLPVFEIANGLKIDVACLGNHEFDYGWQKVPEFIKAAKFPTLSANMVNASGKRLLEPPYVILTTGGLRIAVVGAMMEDLLATTTLQRLGPWHSAPLAETLRPIVTEAKRKADFVVVLGHLTERDIRSILQNLPEVAVVVAGHNHDGLPEMAVDGRIGVNAPGYGTAIGRLELQYDSAKQRIVSHKWGLIPVDSRKYPADSEMKKVVDQWEAKVTAAVDVPIGRANKRLAGPELTAFLEQMLRERTGADFGYQNGGGIRDIIPEGPLLARHVWNMMPFDNDVVTLTVSGRELRELMAAGSLKPARVTNLDTIDPQRVYRITTADFIAQTLADRGRKLPAVNENILVRDLYVEGIRRRGVIP
jgi:2',3'-cyclic-nucleotide 2'-phosphodiesterase (5'-nucleotidase family)